MKTSRIEPLSLKEKEKEDIITCFFQINGTFGDILSSKEDCGLDILSGDRKNSLLNYDLKDSILILTGPVSSNYIIIFNKEKLNTFVNTKLENKYKEKLSFYLDKLNNYDFNEFTSINNKESLLIKEYIKTFINRYYNFRGPSPSISQFTQKNDEFFNYLVVYSAIYETYLINISDYRHDFRITNDIKNAIINRISKKDLIPSYLEAYKTFLILHDKYNDEFVNKRQYINPSSALKHYVSSKLEDLFKTEKFCLYESTFHELKLINETFYLPFRPEKVGDNHFIFDKFTYYDLTGNMFQNIFPVDGSSYNYKLIGKQITDSTEVNRILQYNISITIKYTLNFDVNESKKYAYLPGIGNILVDNDLSRTISILNLTFNQGNDYLNKFRQKVKSKNSKNDNIYIEISANDLERMLSETPEYIDKSYLLSWLITSLFKNDETINVLLDACDITLNHLLNMMSEHFKVETKEKVNFKTYENIHTSKTCENLDYTFGVEIETILGKIYPEEFIENQVICSVTKDGSLRDPDGIIRGGEYVTQVLKGDVGFYKLYRLLKLISKNCKIDRRCGIHIHVGNAKFNKYFNIAAYILAKQLENEIFSLMLPSRRDNDMCGRLFDKRVAEFKSILKNSNDIESGVDMCYHKFFKELSISNEIGRNSNKFSPHPGGRYTFRYQRDINIKKLDRYKWLNFIACNFNMRNKHINKKIKDKNNGFNDFLTLEFRLHHATLNFEEVRNWILICFAFVNFVEKNYNKILKNSESITLKELILFSYTGYTARLLLEHISSSQVLYNESFNEDIYYKESTTSVEFNTLKDYINYVSDNIQRQ